MLTIQYRAEPTTAFLCHYTDVDKMTDSHNKWDGFAMYKALEKNNTRIF